MPFGCNLGEEKFKIILTRNKTLARANCTADSYATSSWRGLPDMITSTNPFNRFVAPADHLIGPQLILSAPFAYKMRVTTCKIIVAFEYALISTIGTS